MFSLAFVDPLDYQRRMAPAPSSSSQVPVHPDVRFKRLAFYDVLGELLKPSSLGKCNVLKYIRIVK